MKKYILFVVLVLSVLTVRLTAATLTDNFEDNNINASFWTNINQGGPVATETNGRMEITIPSNSSVGIFYAGFQFNAKFLGDFDIQVDYSFLNWQAKNGVRAGINFYPYYVGVSTVSFPTDERYCCQFEGSVHSLVTNDISGTLRMTRAGNMMHGYYLDASKNWQLIGSDILSSFPNVPFVLQAWSDNYYFQHIDTTVAFDNFIINSGTLDHAVPEPATLALFSLGGLLLRRRKK